MIQKAVILSTGDEITTGRIVDTNSNYIADKLAEIGIEVVAVPDRGRRSRATGMGVEDRDGDLADMVISTGESVRPPTA